MYTLYINTSPTAPSTSNPFTHTNKQQKSPSPNTKPVFTPRVRKTPKASTPKGELLVRSPKFDVVYIGSSTSDLGSDDDCDVVNGVNGGAEGEELDFDELMKSVDDIVTEIGSEIGKVGEGDVTRGGDTDTDVESIEGELKEELRDIIKTLDEGINEIDKIDI
jgi:hypothetical protein